MSGVAGEVGRAAKALPRAPLEGPLPGAGLLCFGVCVCVLTNRFVSCCVNNCTHCINFGTFFNTTYRHSTMGVNLTSRLDAEKGLTHLKSTVRGWARLSHKPPRALRRFRLFRIVRRLPARRAARALGVPGLCRATVTHYRA